MSASSCRATLAVAGLVGLVAACASGRTSRAPASGTSITARDIEHSGTRPIEAVLQAKAPGALVTRTDDGGIAIQIRGVTSIHGSNEPLYVVDDVPFQPGPGGSLRGVNPYDIETIEVLKNPADIGVYGSRGANGVIRIETKKPGKRD
jgi:TonB-dependent SusC/RagA subfamily outer membrane receptor